MMGRLADTNEIKGAALFLTSTTSSFMTPHNLVLDGGHMSWKFPTCYRTASSGPICRHARCMQCSLGVHRERQDPCAGLDQEDETNSLSNPKSHFLATDAVLPECRSEILGDGVIRSDRLAGTGWHLIKSCTRSSTCRS